MKCKGTSLGTSRPRLVKRVTGTHVAAAVSTSKPATLHQKLYGFHIEPPLVKEQEPEIPKKDAFAKVLRGQIIAFLRGEGQAESTDADYKTFSDVSIDDCDLILEAIAEDDNHQFNRYKISYSPSSKQLVATLPTPIHENLLKPLRDAIDSALASLDIEGLGNFIVQMNSTLRGLGEAGSTEKSLGTPDALLEFHDEDGGRVQLWGTEVTFSQTRDAAIAKLQRSVTLNPHMRAVTLFDILENHRHSPPTESSDAFRKLSKKKKVVSYHKWLQKDDSPVFGPVTGFTHTWVSSLTVVVSTWLRPDDGPFDLYDHNPRYFATARLCPDTDITGLENLQHLFHRTFASLRDATISYMEEVMAEEESSVSSDNSDAEDESSVEDKSDIAEVSSEETDDSPDPFELVRAWVPPTSPIDWKAIMKQLRNAARQTGYTRYSTYHEKLIKRTAEEAEISPRASKRAKRS
ncbi:uncharacterized protein F5891DRAFT_986836 [Suillus fuscotomentosus]|uniref:Uncharacterized protein n=1 Tax=Suillus fuscotomentosus TaxID=1912939 RepID=A0AAD4DR44_9AGAM|nr:uncharacterized protein F5891DRAFT_986836 [Suillus fuscotomentosus]KAG1890683.1 hypothetical protein F5891DRAFT_986836 [Suillus fuscotomentosus]